MRSRKLLRFSQPSEDSSLARFQDFTRQVKLVDDVVQLVEVEDEVELAHVFEVGVEDLDEEVDALLRGGVSVWWVVRAWRVL